MNTHSGKDRNGGFTTHVSGRRQFVKSSLLAAGAVTTLAANLIKADSAEAETAGSGQPLGGSGGTSPLPAPVPVVPYGSGQPIYLADFDRCQPASALSRSRHPNLWMLYDFESEKTKGVMLTAGENTGVPEVEYPLSEVGWFAIYFGILSVENESRLQVRLKNERVFSILTPNNMSKDRLLFDDIQWSKHPYSSSGIEELFWKCAYLDGGGNAFVLGQLKAQVIPGDPDAIGNYFMPCWLAYIKLVPLSEAEVSRLKADRARSDTRRLFAADDSFTPTMYLHFKTEDDIRRDLEPYRDSDFSRIYWEAGQGDLTFYPSNVGRLITFAWMKDHYLVANRLMGLSYENFQAEGIDPLRVAADYSHELGLEFHASYRVGGFMSPPPDDEFTRGGLYERHPEWRCVSREGRWTPKLSYAFPEVQHFVIELLAEIAAGYPVEGVCLLYNRRLPVLEYEAPLVDSFKAKYGVDARSLDERDSRWLGHRATFLTEFMRALRQRMRTEEQRLGRKPIGITAVVLGSRRENFENGIDLDSWVKEGLVDTLVPYIDPLIPYLSGRRHQGGELAWDDPGAIGDFVRLTRNTRCVLAPNLMPRAMEPEEYRRIARSLYEAGVDSFFFWDCYMRYNFDPGWSALRRLGHKDELKQWAESGSPPMARPESALFRLGNWDMRYQTPG